jgi:pimeloyl-ACP methyl ester carboxylesterase
MKRMLVGCLLSFCMVHPVMASDLEKEQRWRDEVEDLIMDGESVDLMVDGRAVFSIFTEASEASDKGMIVVHGTGIHPNWEQVVQPIRVGMTNHGWHTLAIQMPILRNGAEYHEYAAIYPEVPARLQAAEAFMREKGIKTLLIVAHSQGATMSSYFLSRNPSDASGFLAIGMNANQNDADINSAESLKKINIPVLDLYGSNDLPAVLETAERRKQGGAHNTRYSQQVVEGANHFFDGMNEELLSAVVNWSSRF